MLLILRSCCEVRTEISRFRVFWLLVLPPPVLSCITESTLYHQDDNSRCQESIMADCWTCISILQIGWDSYKSRTIPDDWDMWSLCSYHSVHEASVCTDLILHAISFMVRIYLRHFCMLVTKIKELLQNEHISTDAGFLSCLWCREQCWNIMHQYRYKTFVSYHITYFLFRIVDFKIIPFNL